MMRIESSWSGLPQAPNIIVPRQSGETWTPVRPSGRYSMVLLSSGFGDLASERFERDRVGLRASAAAGVEQVDSRPSPRERVAVAGIERRANGVPGLVGRRLKDA